jgi:hypothetical protein
LASSLNVACPVTVVWNYPTPDALARMLLEQLQHTSAPEESGAARSAPPSPAQSQPRGNSSIVARLTELESLSEAEVYQNLLKTSNRMNHRGDNDERRQHAKAYSVL